MNRGSIMIMTMFAISLLSTLIIGFLSVVTTDLMISRHDAWSRQALYVAESGAMEAIYQLTQNRTWNRGFSNMMLTAGQYYSVSIDNQDPIVRITSTGEALDYTRIIEAQVAIVSTLRSGEYKLRVDSWEEL